MRPLASHLHLFIAFASLAFATPGSGKILYSELSGCREGPIESAAMADTDYVVPMYRTCPRSPPSGRNRTRGRCRSRA